MIFFQEYVPGVTCPPSLSTSRFPDNFLFDLYFICHKKRCQSSVALHQVKTRTPRTTWEANLQLGLIWGFFFPRIQVTWFDKCKVMYFFYFWSDTGTTPYESCFFSFFLNLSAILGKYFTIYSKYHTVMQIMFPGFFFCKLGN